MAVNLQSPGPSEAHYQDTFKIIFIGKQLHYRNIWMGIGFRKKKWIQRVKFKNGDNSYINTK